MPVGMRYVLSGSIVIDIAVNTAPPHIILRHSLSSLLPGVANAAMRCSPTESCRKRRYTHIEKQRCRALLILLCAKSMPNARREMVMMPFFCRFCRLAIQPALRKTVYTPCAHGDIYSGAMPAKEFVIAEALREDAPCCPQAPYFSPCHYATALR